MEDEMEGPSKQWNEKGYAKLLSGDLRHAKTFFNKAVEADPRCYKAKINLAIIEMLEEQERIKIQLRNYSI